MVFQFRFDIGRLDVGGQNAVLPEEKLRVDLSDAQANDVPPPTTEGLEVGVHGVVERGGRATTQGQGRTARERGHAGTGTDPKERSP